MGVKVISERTLDNKTIKLTDARDAIEVQISNEKGNLLQVKDDGLFLQGSKDVGASILLEELDGTPLGLIVPQ